ncbi:MAG: GntR family transcriptional regulator [Acidobacteriota bacterium]|nr:GntR family transcriptional regulator [Acidobacteriota bacterium]
MVPFRVSFEPGVPLYEQVVYAARKAVVTGQMKPGDPFPSVRTLSRELKINPNTAHKIIAQLLEEGLIESHVGVGTIVAGSRASTAAERSQLMKNDLEKIVVEARHLGLELEDVLEAIEGHWQRLTGSNGEAAVSKGERRRS